MCPLPPSTGRICPVIFAAASLNKKTVAFATSLTWLTRPRGYVLESFSDLVWLVKREKPSVPPRCIQPSKRVWENIMRILPVGPGAITLERTPMGPSSTARTRERASTAALAADTCTWYGEPDGRRSLSHKQRQSH